MDLKDTIPQFVRAGKRLGPAAIFLIIIILGYTSYYTVKWVPNEHFENVTMYNATTGNSSNSPKVVLYYGRGDQVPVKQIGKNGFSTWGFEQVFFLTVGLLVFFIISKSRIEENMKTEAECREIVSNRLSLDRDVNKYFLLRPFWVQRFKNDDNESKPVRSWVYASVEMKDVSELEGGWMYMAFGLNSFTGMIEAILTLHSPPDSKHTCQHCGSVPDMKIITPEGIRELMEKFGMRRR